MMSNIRKKMSFVVKCILFFILCITVNSKETQLIIKSYPIQVEVAENKKDQEQGLMYRSSLARNDGMFFVFQDTGYHCFWMQNTYIALSIAFIKENGRIVDIKEMDPMTENIYCSAEPVRYALEMNKKWFSKRKIKKNHYVHGSYFIKNKKN